MQIKEHFWQLCLPLSLSFACLVLQISKRIGHQNLSLKTIMWQIFEGICLYIGYIWIYHFIHMTNIFGRFLYVKEICFACFLLLFKYRQIVLSADKFNEFAFGVYYIPLQLILIQVAANYDPVVYCFLTISLNRLHLGFICIDKY